MGWKDVLGTKLDKHIWVEDRGAFVSENTRRLAEVINDYDSRLFLAPIPDELRKDDPDYAYGLIYENPNGHNDFIFKFKESEMLNPADILKRILVNDTQRTDVLVEIDKMSEAQRLLEMKERMEQEEEKKELAIAMLKSPLHTYKHKGKKYS